MDIFDWRICLTFQVWLNSCLHDLFSYFKQWRHLRWIQTPNHFYDSAISILVDYFKLYSVNNSTKFKSYIISVNIVNRLWDRQSMNRVSILGRDKGFFFCSTSAFISAVRLIHYPVQWASGDHPPRVKRFWFQNFHWHQLSACTEAHLQYTIRLHGMLLNYAQAELGETVFFFWTLSIVLIYKGS